jgi:aminopeptidase
MTVPTIHPMDPAAFADLLVGYCLDVKSEQRVLVRSTTLATPLLLELERAILERQAWPMIRVELPGQQAGFFRHARDLHLDEVDGLALNEAKKVSSLLAIQAPFETHPLADVDPAKIARLSRGRQVIREATMKKRWCTTLWPTEAGAEQAHMTLDDFGAFVRNAMFLDRPDPVGGWRELSAFHTQVMKRLAKVDEIRIEAPGTDLTLSVKGRLWVNSDGKRNMPSGEVFTGPHETSADGRVRFTIPSSPAGVRVIGVELEFRAGVVVDARAEEGEEYLLHALDTDPGARRLGEIGIGTNFGITQPIGAILFDEKIGGTVHLALGRSYGETGGVNPSALHWDLICDLRDGGRLSGDGKPIVENGKFVA